MKSFNLKKIDEQNVIIQGRDLSIEDRETGKVYITSKAYIDKLFNEIGYKNLNVIKTLEDYAGKYITEVGRLSTSSIFVDEDKGSFIVTSQNVIDRLNEMFIELNTKGFELIEIREYDNTYFWDQYLLKSPSGVCFAAYLDLADEEIYLLSLDYKNNKLHGMINEGKYDMSAEDFINQIITIMMSPINASAMMNYSQTLSIDEYIDLLSRLGYVKKKRKIVTLLDKGEACKDDLGQIDQIIDDYNISTWIQRHVKDSGIPFSKVCDLISDNLIDITFWNVRDLFSRNMNEKSDMFALNA